MRQASYIIVFVTCSSTEEAENIAVTLVKKRVAACGNIVPGIRSVFWWKNSLEHEQEVLLMLKSRADLFPKIEDVVNAFHSYEVPEIIAIPIAAGSDAYLTWLEHETRASA